MQRLRMYFLPVMVFLLPWQTRWIYAQSTVGGEAFELGTMSLYAVELLAIAGLLFVHRQSTRVPRATRWALLLIALGVISSLWAINDQLAITYIVHLVAALALFVSVFDKSISTRHIVWGFVLGLILPTLLGIWQVVVGSSPAFTELGLAVRDAQTLGDTVLMVGGERILRAYGSFPHPNIFGGYLTIGLLGVLWLWQGAAMRFRRWLVPIGFLLFTGLILTFSRSAWLALMIVAIPLMVRVLLKNVHGWRGWLSAVKGARLAFAVGILTVVLLSPLIASRFAFDELIESRSLTERVEQYEVFGQIFSGHWLAGVGLANYTLAIEKIEPGQQWWEYQPVHNAWALLIGELGFIGVVLVLCVVISLMRVHYHRLWLLTVGLLPLLVISLFDHYLWSLWPGLALLALTVALTTRINAQV